MGFRQILAGLLNIILLFHFVCSFEDEIYNEELFIRPTHEGAVYSHFEFATQWHKEGTGDHYKLFPKALGEIVSLYNVEELHLTLTQGLWKYQRWGFPLRPAPAGLELVVWFKEEETSVDDQWQNLVNVLGGMLCTSLNFVGPKTTITPQMAFKMEGVTRAGRERNVTQLRYASLPAELACTENLTPWAKLLPCGLKKGLASLFQAKNLLNSNYHSMGIHLRPACWKEECVSTALDLRLTLASVSRTVTQWNLQSLFGRGITSVCALAESSKIHLDLTHKAWFDVSPTPEQIIKHRLCEFAVYDLTPSFDLSLTYHKGSATVKPPEPPIHVHRFLSGYGQERGGVVTQITNSLPEELHVVLLETIPWYLRLYLHTLTIHRNGTHHKPERLYYKPGGLPDHPYHVEMVLTLPPESQTTVSVAVEKLFLKWQEYPPDANHGFYAPSAVISTLLPANTPGLQVMQNTHSSLIQCLSSVEGERLVRLHSETLLVSLPTPDFSMPFNVLCLTCTVVAIAFGSIHNMSTRQLLPSALVCPSFLSRLKTKVKAALAYLRGKIVPAKVKAD